MLELLIETILLLEVALESVEAISTSRTLALVIIMVLLSEDEMGWSAFSLCLLSERRAFARLTLKLDPLARLAHRAAGHRTLTDILPQVLSQALYLLPLA